MNNLLPSFIDGDIFDGKYIHVLPFCKSNCCKGKCQDYYSNIKEKGGFHCCPYGMSSYVDISTGIIFTGFRNKSFYSKEKAKRLRCDTLIYNPILPSQQIEELLKVSLEIDLAEKNTAEREVILNSISHEVKKLNAQIKERCDVVLQTLCLLNDEFKITEENVKEIQSVLKTIYVSSSMIDSRFSMLNYEKNPNILKGGSTFECNIYKKFHKIQMIFKNYQKRNIPITISGESFAKIYAYQSFELIPMLIVENAIKYSYDYNNSVNINFDDDKNGNLTVKISSYSPHCSKEDITHIFEKGYRGRYAKKVASDGGGIGLYFVKLLCDAHSIEIDVVSDSKISQINGVPYSQFTVSLYFQNIIY